MSRNIRDFIPKNPDEPASPPSVGSQPVLDTERWEAWLEKNRQRDKVKRAKMTRTVAVIVLLAMLLWIGVHL